MASEPDDHMDTSRAIAAALGITGFGAAHGTTRKRQRDQAFTESNYADFYNDASGCNAVPLGPRRKSDDSGAPDSEPEGAAAKSSVEPDASPAAARSTPSPLAATSANQGPGLDAGNSTDPTAGMTAGEARKHRKKTKSQHVATGLAAFLAFGQKLPDRPSNPPETSSTPADSIHAATPTSSDAKPGQSGDNHVQAPQQNMQSTDSAAKEGVQPSRQEAAVNSDHPASNDIAYFRSSFIEDPWRNLIDT